jgi:hemolysin III
MNVRSDGSGRRQLTAAEETVNAITHGMGIPLSIAGLVILVVTAVTYGNTWHVVSFSVFGASLIACYTSSTLYHSFSGEKIKNLFARFDHASIFLLIAGTYTPFLLTVIKGVLGWTMFGIIWGLAIAGIVIRSIYLERFRKLMVAIYLIMGWMIVFAIKPVLNNLPSLSLVLLLAGGISYSAGVVFYAWRKLPYSHSIWHLFVLGGSITHFFAILYTLF